MAALLTRGESVLLPFGEGHVYDLVIERCGVFSSVQCKTGRLKNGRVLFFLYSVARDTKTKKYTKRRYGTSVDLYGVFCPQNDATYLIPSKNLPTNQGTLVVDLAQVKKLRKSTLMGETYLLKHG